MTLPRNAQIWLPGYWAHRASSRRLPPPKRVWLMIGDHYEPMGQGSDMELARQRVARWRTAWPEVARRFPDSADRPAVYTFFYAEEQYAAALLDPLAEIRDLGFGDVEIHLHHDGEGEQNFVDRMSRFQEVLHHRHGFLRRHKGALGFGFIHGNWALDNSRDGRYCGLNNEITLLKRLGCYADFTLPSAPYVTQTKTVNSIYWATDDPARPKSHDTGIPVEPGAGTAGDLLMVQGPLALNWSQRKHGVLPRVETGDLDYHSPATPHRVRLWLDHAPRVGGDIFIKLFAHGASGKNLDVLLNGGLAAMYQMVTAECRRRNIELRYASAWEVAQAIFTLAGHKEKSSAGVVQGMAV